MDTEWLKEQFKRTSKSQADLARYLKLDTTIVNKMVKGRRTIKAGEADRIREFFGVQPLYGRTENGATGMRGSTSLSLEPQVTAPLPSQMRKDVPVYGTVSGGAGSFQVGGEAIDWVRRPPRLDGRKDVFGLFVADVSMIPAYRPGALIFVERARPPAAGDDVVLEIGPEKEGGDQLAILKHLVAITPTVIKLEQHNPAKVFEIPQGRIIHMYRVMTLMDLLGV